MSGDRNGSLLHRVIVVGVYALIIAFAVVPTIAFFVVERVTNGEPEVDPGGHGWVAVVMGTVGPKGTYPNVTEARLDATFQKTDGDEPGGLVSYRVSVCGQEIIGQPMAPLRGLILLAGDARLDGLELGTNDEIDPQLGAMVQQEPWQPKKLPDSVQLASRRLSLKGVQAVPIEVQNVPCRSDIAAPPVGIYGRSRVPLMEPFRFAGMTGGHQRRTWPVLGVRGLPVDDFHIPGVSAPDGAVTADPDPLFDVTTITLNGGGVGSTVVVDSVSPTPVNADDMVFVSKGRPLEASARTTDINVLERWRTRLTFLAILVGVAGGIFATLVIDGLRKGGDRMDRRVRAAGSGDPG